jgi:predicted GNAT superfamily acetyltransferase
MAEITYKQLVGVPYIEKCREIMKSVGWDKQVSTTPDLRPVLDSNLKVGYVIGAFDKDKLVGYIRVLTGSEEHYIVDTAVIPNYQNQGIGSRLLKEVYDESKKRTVKKIVWTYNILAQNGKLNRVYLALPKDKYNLQTPKIVEIKKDYYGILGTPAEGHGPSHRVLVHWDITSENREKGGTEIQLEITPDIYEKLEKLLIDEKHIPVYCKTEKESGNYKNYLILEKTNAE